MPTDFNLTELTVTGSLQSGDKFYLVRGGTSDFATTFATLQSELATWGKIVGDLANQTDLAGQLSVLTSAVAARLTIVDAASTYLTPAQAAAAYQPKNGNLTALAAIAVSGIPYRRSLNLWQTIVIGAGLELDNDTGNLRVYDIAFHGTLRGLITPTETQPQPAGVVDLDTSYGDCRSLVPAANLTFTISNPISGKTAMLRIVNGATPRTFTFPGGWVWVGASAPAGIDANKTGILTVTSFGTSDADCVAAYAAQP